MIVDDDPKVRALVAALRKVCAKLPGAEEYVMVHHPAFRVGKKPFAIAGLDSKQRGSALSINLGRDAQDGLLGDPRFVRTPYIGQHGWVTIAQGELEHGELGVLVTESWRRVANKKQLAVLDGTDKARVTKLKPEPRARR
jgi:predicted DNA-binding protein (MmcQ/YjbR family)